MAGYDLDIKIKPKYHQDGKKLLEFIKRIGNNYPVYIRYRSVSKGEYYLTINATPGTKIDALIQEIILSKSLFYYSNTIKNRKEIIREVIFPIIYELISSRFYITYKKYLRRHILGIINVPFIWI